MDWRKIRRSRDRFSLARDGASRPPTDHHDPPDDSLDRLEIGGGKRRSSAIDLRPSKIALRIFSFPRDSAPYFERRGEARRSGAHGSSCSMRQRHFVINGPRATAGEMYPADYLKFKCRAASA